ncbi:hypothetical protein ACN9ML_11905 [Dyadobacter endophyticus]|uniref:hypothetical protein n=1 Tax=Dyadobacter endophyticus TaxID=1749036 RepID=UPI003CF22A3F
MLRFYFQSGEFHSDQGNFWIGVFKDFLIPLAGVGVPLLLFYLGLRQERRRADKQRNEDNEKLDRAENLRLLYFHSLLVEALKFCCHFQDVLDSVGKSLNENKYSSNNLALDGGTDLKRIVVDLDRERLFYAYRMRIEDQSLNVTFKALDAVYGLRGTFGEVWERSSREITSRKNGIRSSTSDFGLRVLEVNVDNPDDSNLRDQLMQILIGHGQKEYSEERQYQELIESLATPFATTIEGHQKSRDSNWSSLYNKVLSVQILDKQVESIVSQYLHNVEEISLTVERAVSDLFKHYLPLEDYLIEQKLLTKRLADGLADPNGEGSYQATDDTEQSSLV